MTAHTYYKTRHRQDFYFHTYRNGLEKNPDVSFPK
jgi:hypothetical protein